MRRTKRVLAGVLSGLLLIQATGCTSWHTVAQPWPTAIAQSPEKQVRVVLVDGPTITADSVRIVADSLLVPLPLWTVTARGSVKDSSWSARFFNGQGPDTIPLAKVTTVTIREHSTGKTIGLVLGGLVAVFLLLAGIAFANCGPC